MKTNDILLEKTQEIWDNGEFIETKRLRDMDISLYIFQKEYFLIWYENNDLRRTEKINKTTAKILFPENKEILFL
jgi:hypothetical protein